MAISKHMEMVGRLAVDSEVKRSEEDPRNAVFINNEISIQYSIKSLSIKNNINTDLFTGYLTSIQNLEFVDDQYGDKDSRVDSFKKYYTDSLFIFTHKIESRDNYTLYKVDIANEVLKPHKITETSRFVAIPIFSTKTTCNIVNDVFLYRKYDSYSEFIDRLFDSETLGRIYNFEVNDSTNFPEFIIWKEKDKLSAIGPVKLEPRATGYNDIVLHIDRDNYHEIDLESDESDFSEYIVGSDANPTLLHLTEEKYFDIVNKISIKDDAKQTPITQTSNSIDTDNHADTKIPETPSTDIIEQSINDIRELPTEKSEAAIFEFFRYHSQNRKLFYSPKDIINFHTALKTGNLVILSGMSGTGKSALINTYAEALGIKNNVLMIPVRPSWNDDSDLLGYVDLIHMVYRPSDTGFINKIVEASENKDKLYLICFDEMNLARVEHYFSQFLSILEKPIGSRDLVLYDKQYEGQLYNSTRYPQVISLGDNIKFIGTVNIDESTHHFSDKVLDRANVISLEVLDYSNPINWKEDKYKVSNTPTWGNEDFNKIIKKDDVSIPKQDRIREFLWKTHTLLHEMNANLGVGPRILKSIEAYLRNIPECDNEYVLSIQEGLDFQVAQRVLTKIRGPEEQLKELFTSADSVNNPLIALMDSYADISKFEKCKKAILQKEKELRIYGYCL